MNIYTNIENNKKLNMKNQQDYDSQDVKIIGPKIDNQNNNNKDAEPYPAFKNKLKILFSEFANEEGQNLNMPSVPAINFSEKIIELPNGCIRLLIFLLVILICVALVIAFAIVGKTCYFIIPVPILGIIVCMILMCNFTTISLEKPWF